MIELIHLFKNYQSKNEAFVALQDINLVIPQGEIVSIVGKSGAGKSTLLRCMNLLERPTTGSVLFNGLDLTKLNPHELRQERRKIGFIFQHFNLLSHATVFKNIALPLQVANFSKSKIEKRVQFLLEMTGLSDKINRYPDELSGGQKQRVAIARALANNPSVLLCDEATSALDLETSKSILNLLKSIHDEFKITIILVTHQSELVKFICNRVIVMDEGSIQSSSYYD